MSANPFQLQGSLLEYTPMEVLKKLEPSLVGISLETNRHPLAILGPLPLGEPSTPYFQYTLFLLKLV